MDAKKAYGVETALGRAIAQNNLEDGLRKVETPEEFRRFVESLHTPLPRDVVTQWAERVEDAHWRKVRSKLLLGAQVARGTVAEVSDDAVERHGVGSARH